MADRVILMRAGTIQQNGEPAVLYEHPQTVFTARFIGSPPMNVLPAAILAGHGALAAGAPAQRDLAAMLFGVRPEALRIAAQGLPARVIAVEYLGGDSQIEARVGEENLLLRISGTPAVRPGEQVHLAWTPRDAHWFDMSSQCRIAGA